MIAALLGLGCALPLGAAAPETPVPFAVVGCRVLSAGEVRERATVLVSNGRIERVETAGAAVPEGYERVDGRARTLLPGLFDLHVHLLADGAAAAVAHARQALAGGVVFLLDLGGSEPAVFDLAERSRVDGAAFGALVWAAGSPFTAPGGHGGEGGFPAHEIATPEDLERALPAPEVDRRDVFKVMFERGGYGSVPELPTIDESLLRRLVAEAHRRGRRVFVHALNWDDARRAVLAGADALAHLPLAGEPASGFFDLMERRGVVVVSTLAAFRAAVERSDRDTARWFARRLQRARGWLRALVERGLALPGSDAGAPGVPFDGGTLAELREWRAAGVEVPVLLAAATRGAARFLYGESTRRGLVEAGAPADLWLVEGDPTRSFDALRRTAAVWREGRPAPAAERSDAAGRSPPPRSLVVLAPTTGARPPLRLGPAGTVVEVERLEGDEQEPAARWRLAIDPGVRTSPDRPAGVRFPLVPAMDFTGFDGLRVRLRAERRLVLRLRFVPSREEGVDPWGWDLGVDTTWRSFVLPFERGGRRGFGHGSPRPRFDGVAALDLVVESDVTAFWVELGAVRLYAGK